MKLAKDKDDKREIAKTLDGLTRFYSENANVQQLLFVIYAKEIAEVDKLEWEGRYSLASSRPKIKTKVIHV